MVFIFSRSLAYNELLRHYLLVNTVIAIYRLEQQAACLHTHLVTLVDNGRELRGYIFGMRIIGKAYERHILRDAQAFLLDGCERSKGDDIVECQ